MTTKTFVDNLARAVAKCDWELATAETRELTHGIHRYSGKFIPQIASQAISLLTTPGDRVLDIYCGSGTTLLEAALLDRKSVGIDLNPLALLISKVKTRPLPERKLSQFLRGIREELEGATDEAPLFAQGSATSKDDPRLKDEWFTKWYQPHVLPRLCQIHQAIMGCSDAAVRDVGLVAFSDVVRRASKAHNGYPNVMFDKNAKQRPNPVPHFLNRLSEVVAAVAELSALKNFERPEVREGDATSLDFDDNSFDAVVSHPPYIASVPYAEYGSLSLGWLGHDAKALDKRLTGGVRQSKDVVERFEAGYSKAIAEAFRVLRPGGHMFLMVGNPLVKGERIDLAEMTNEFAIAAGFRLSASAERVGVNRRANKMGAEHLLFFAKA